MKRKQERRKLQKIQYHSEASLFERIRFPLLALIIFYPVVLGLFLKYGGGFYFAEFSTIIAVFLIPVVSAFLLGVQRTTLKYGMKELFGVESLFGVLATAIFVVVTLVFAIPLVIQEVLTLLMVMLMLHYGISLLLHLRKPTPFIVGNRLIGISSPHFKTPLLAFEFGLDNYLRRIGTLHLVAAALLIIFLGIFFGRLGEVFLFVVLFILVLKALEGIIVLKSDILLYLVLAGMSIFALVSVLSFQSFFGILVLIALALTVLITFGHRGILALPAHFLNTFLATVYAATVLLLFVGLFAVFENLFVLSQLLPPIVIMVIIAVVIILVCIIFYYLLFSLTLRSVGTLNIQKMLWPFSLFISPRGNPQKDALLFGTILGLLVIIIFTIVLILL